MNAIVRAVFLVAATAYVAAAGALFFVLITLIKGVL